MPFPSFTTGAVAPVDGKETRDKKKQHRHNSRNPSIRKRPILLNVRSSDYFIFATAAIGLFSSTFVHSILFPLSPFIINRINHGDDAQLVDSNNSTLTPSTISSANVETSRDTGILVALYAVGLLAGSPIFGWLGDKIKQRRIPMLLGISASIAANLMFMFAFAYWMLLLARFLQGVSNAAVWTMSLCLIADNWPENQLGLQMGKLVGFYPLGMMAGLPIGVLYGKLGHQAPFIASMILCGVDFFMRVVIVERCHAPREWFINTDRDAAAASNEEEQLGTPPLSNYHHHRLPEISTTHTNMSSCCSYSETSDELQASGTTTTTQHDDTFASDDNDATAKKVTLGQLLRRPRLLVALHTTVVVAAVMSAFESTLTMQLASEWKFDEAAIGLILIAYMLPAIASGAVSGWLCDRYGTKIVALVSLILVTPACVAIGIPNRNTPFWPLVLLLAIGGMTMAGCQSPIFPEIASVVARENERHKGKKRDGLATSYALFNAAYGAGMSFGPILAGFLYGTVGFFWLCFTLGMMFVVCIPFSYAFTGQDRRHSTKTDVIEKPPTTASA
ncbi:hypothetical protein LRAMOSA06956 [Lichtheimia ramosa]|uniref:Major facilitator superfamily (MFS) profile domain-containing protein n=1 Tax=Lichtheimia ramosa TaxID=688394 RepID=A0A077WAF3_9FUNG|nr:hypothetical protein LRAMOSA06956 [Lichtheimia ramosa]